MIHTTSQIVLQLSSTRSQYSSTSLDLRVGVTTGTPSHSSTHRTKLLRHSLSYHVGLMSSLHVLLYSLTFSHISRTFLVISSVVMSLYVLSCHGVHSHVMLCSICHIEKLLVDYLVGYNLPI